MNTQKLNQAISLLNEILSEQKNQIVFPPIEPANMLGIRKNFREFAKAIFTIYGYKKWNPMSKEIRMLMIEHNISRIDNWYRHLEIRGIVKVEKLTAKRTSDRTIHFLKQIL